MDEKIDEPHHLMYESERYLKAIIESSIDGITVVDEHGKFEFANDSFFRIIEWPREEIIGNYFMKIIPEDMKELCIQKWDTIQKGIPDDFEIGITTKSGIIKYVRVAHKLTIINGKNKVVSVTKNITENKELESFLKESEANYKD